ncbi:MAG: ABC transporter substrate-binding protein [Actinomycetota bacterium]|nr:ABC transporter substrate-binding protein [Actinomycetota bacterium]
MNNRKVAAIVGTTVLALALTSCASERDDDGGTDNGADNGADNGSDTGDAGGDDTGGDDAGAEQSDATFVFGAAGAPVAFDPFYASDGETFRITRQIYENLIQFEEGGAQPGPGLAESWEPSEDGLTWTFNLRDGVTFHDGTEFNAEAVCANFERWYNQEEIGQNPAVTYYWNADFGGFAGTDTDSLYESCEVIDELTAEVTVTRVTSKFPTVLGQSAYAIHSPTALEEYDADNVQTQGEGFVFPEYATEHPTGTGPFTFGSYDAANGTITLERFEDYWGEPAGVAQLVFRIIPDESTRRQELEAGTIQGYDLPNPVDWAALEESGNQVEIRPAFNILYVGLNPTTMPELTDERVRQALYHAINREQLVASQLPEGAEVATQMMPDTVSGYNAELEPVEYDPELAEQLLAEAGMEDLTIDLWYPTEVTRPYMPDPQRIYDAVRADWEAVGITVNPVAKPWNGGYLDGVQQNQAPAYFLGWTGDYDSPANFIGTFFEAEDNNFATHEYEWGPQLSEDLRAADGEPDEETRQQMYQELNADILEYLPALPISHSPPAIVVAENVRGLVPSPLTAENFATITIEE